MKAISILLKSIGITLLFTGGAGMDSVSLIAPIVMIATGLFLALIGERVSEEYA